MTVIKLFNESYQHTSVPFIWASRGLPFLSLGHYFSEPVGGVLVEPLHGEGAPKNEKVQKKSKHQFKKGKTVLVCSVYNLYETNTPVVIIKSH